jgi:hypothetical protein
MFARREPEQQRFSADLHQLRSRDVKLFFAYFGLDTDFNHAGQFEEMTGLAPSRDVRVFFHGGADHILYKPAHRAETVAETCAWLAQSFS